MVVADMKVTTDKVFTAISVTAEKWVSLVWALGSAREIFISPTCGDRNKLMQSAFVRCESPALETIHRSQPFLI